MLTIWAKQSKGRVFSALSPVLRSYPDMPVDVVPSGVATPNSKLIMALGSDPLQYLASQGLIPKNRTVTSLRGAQHLYGVTPLMLSYSPDIGDIDHAFYVDLLTDISLAVRFVHTGTLKPVYGKYRYIDDFSELIEQIKARYAATGEPVPVAADLETLGKDPWAPPTLKSPGAYIVSIQMSMQRGTGDVVYFNSPLAERQALNGLLGEQLEWLLNTPMVSMRGANLKFDLIWLSVRAAIECTNFRFDTTLVGSLLDENRSNGLDVHTKIYVPSLGGYSDEFDASVDKSRMDLVPKDKLLPYAGGDVDADLQVADAQKAELLQDPALTAFYVNILHPGSRAFENIERGGVLVDLNAYKELESAVDIEIDGLLAKAKRIMGGRVVAKHYDSSKRGGLNLTKASLLTDFMFSPMGLNLKPKMFTPKSDPNDPTPSTAADHIEMFINDPEAQEFVQVFQDYGKAARTKSTYIGEIGVSGFLKHLRSDGRFHPSYWLFTGDKSEGEGGTVTGRLSAKDPSFQTIPKHTKWAKMIRRCFPAPPGCLVEERDYSQGELKVIACIAWEMNMIAAYKEGRDLHSETAGPFRGYSYAQMMELKKTDKELFGEIRQLGKAGNFGLCFGMGWEGFQVYAKLNYGVTLTDKEAQDFRSSFFERYPGLTRYHKEYKDRAKRDQMVRGPLGRIRHLPLIKSPNQEFRSKAERQAINSPVQMTLSDMLMWVLGLENAQGLTKIAPAFGAIHDAAYNYVPEDKADIIVPKHLEIMENLPFHLVGWTPQLKFTADAKLGPNMADLKEYGKAA